MLVILGMISSKFVFLQKISKKLKEIDVELEGNMNKLKANEDELKMLQDKYNHIKK